MQKRQNSRLSGLSYISPCDLYIALCRVRTVLEYGKVDVCVFLKACSGSFLFLLGIVSVPRYSTLRKGSLSLPSPSHCLSSCRMELTSSWPSVAAVGGGLGWPQEASLGASQCCCQSLALFPCPCPQCCNLI